MLAVNLKLTLDLLLLGCFTHSVMGEADLSISQAHLNSDFQKHFLHIIVSEFNGSASKVQLLHPPVSTCCIHGATALWADRELLLALRDWQKPE